MSSRNSDPSPAEPVRVVIHDQYYNLRSDGDPDYVRHLAEFVDERMRVISEHTRVVDYAKIAVLAALNIADELHRMRLASAEAEAAAASASQGPAAETSSPEAPPETEARREESDAWSYRDIFESLPARSGTERMSSRISVRLRQRKLMGEAAGGAETNRDQGEACDSKDAGCL